jgi:hypothetical protein
MLGYQWLKNGTAISGATGATYYTSAIAQTDARTMYTRQVH